MTRYGKDTEYVDPTVDTEYEDDGTMSDNVAELAATVVGRRIVSVTPRTDSTYGLNHPADGADILLDDGCTVELAATGDCCAYTELDAFLLHPDRVDHVILGVDTEDGYKTWHIFADMGDVLDLTVDWSCGNPFYYGYGFDIRVKDPTP